VAAPRESLVLPEFGPTLPAIVRRRFGLAERTTIALVVAAVALAALALLVVRPEVDRITHLVHRGQPVFNLTYDHGALHAVEPRAGELARLEGRRGRLAVSVTVQPVRLPAQSGDIAHGLLPTYASGHIDALRASLDRFKLRAEGRARINDAPGYEVRFRTGPPGHRTFGNDVIVLPAEDDERDALLLSARREIAGKVKLGEPGQALSDATAEAYRSFRYGTDPK
jgi:hypothetical protein